MKRYGYLIGVLCMLGLALFFRLPPREKLWKETPKSAVTSVKPLPPGPERPASAPVPQQAPQPGKAPKVATNPPTTAKGKTAPGAVPQPPGSKSTGTSSAAPPPIAGGPPVPYPVGLPRHAPNLPTFPWGDRESKFNQKLDDHQVGEALNQVRQANAQPYIVAGLPFSFPTGNGASSSTSTGKLGGSSSAFGGVFGSTPSSGSSGIFGGSTGTSSGVFGGGMSSGTYGGGGGGGFPAVPATGSPPPPTPPPAPAPESPPAPPAPPATPPALAALFGNWEGVVRPDGGDRPYQLLVTINGKIDGGKLRGDLSIELSRDGVLVSRTSESGDLSTIRQGPQGSSAIQLQPSGPYVYWIYYLKQTDSFAGILYQRVDTDSYPPVAKIELHRKN